MPLTLYFGDLLPYTSILLQSLWTSIYITLVAMAAGGALGVLLYLGKAGTIRPVQVVCNVYIEIFRNTPLLVQLYLIYFGLTQFGINLTPLWAGMIGLSLHNAAYIAEIYRAGFDAVPGGLRESGSALGMHSRQIFRYIVFMPGIRNVFPALTNQLILTFLASSIASIIGLPELMTAILNINAETDRAVEILAVGGGLYLVTGLVLTLISRFAESRLFAWGVKAHV
jgi:polar amino acid transport system permease protein